VFEHDFLRQYNKLIIIFGLFCLLAKLNGQITSVDYQLKYNVDSCWYDAFLIVNFGSAVTVSERQQDYTQYSIIIPTATNINIVRNYMPIVENETFTGTEPVNWVINSIVNAPLITPTLDYYIFSPSSDYAAHYNLLNAGDTVKLFSFEMDTIFQCSQNIRLYQNGIDPGPSAPGMGFLDFSQDFNLVSGAQLFSENAPQVFPPSPDISTSPIVTCHNGIEITTSTSTNSCQSTLNYRWSGPNNFNSTTQNINISPAYSIHSGEYKIVVADAFGCKDSIMMWAENKPYAGDDLVACAGTSINISGTQPNTGIWSSSPTNNGEAILTDLGNGVSEVTFTSLAEGLYGFIYENYGCFDTMNIEVYPLPMVGIIGSDSICILASTTIFPNSGGYWVNNMPEIATTSTTGNVIGLADGTANFTFTNFSDGCSATTENITINPKPEVLYVGNSEICIGSTTTLSPSMGGYWTSSDTLIASITNNGEVTGHNIGMAYMVFTNAITQCISDSLVIIVRDVPVPIIVGTDQICVQNTTQLTPNAGGIWTSNHPAIASINNAGEVLGIATGFVTFTFTDTLTWCSSDSSEIITVVNGPQTTLNTDNICEGTSTFVSPNTGGTWMSTNTNTANVGLNTGAISGLAEGWAQFVFTRQSDGCISVSDTLFVNPRPIINANPTIICVGSVAELSSVSSGVWTSLDSDIIVISDTLGIGVGSGIVTLNFSDSITSCQNTLFVTVNSRPFASILDDSEICQGLQTQLSPSTNGEWSSSNTSVATVTNEGIVTGIAQGTAIFYFTETSTNCNSLPTPPVTVLPLPTISFSGLDSICIGNNSTLFSNEDGSWISTDPNIADVDPNSGLVTAVSAGATTFRVTSYQTGCISNLSAPLTVHPLPITSIEGSLSICIENSSQLSTTSGGFWTTSNPTVASVDNQGQVIGLSEGTVFFTFTDTLFGCNYESSTEVMTVNACNFHNHDINATFTNILVYGDLSVNDPTPVINLDFNNPILISSPAGSQPQLVLAPDGNYTFISDLQGIYTYDINLCILPNDSVCLSSKLYITVKDLLDSSKLVSANMDLVSTIVNAPILIKPLENDVCLVMATCQLNPASMTLINNPENGDIVFDHLNGFITYNPHSDFSGTDSLTYQVCVVGDATNCDTAQIFIHIQQPNGSNAIVGTDDLKVTTQNVTLTGNVLDNDHHAENHEIETTSQSIISTEGEFTLFPDGNFEFVPARGYFGSINYSYEICPQNALGNCVNATLYILVLKDFQVKLKVYLEGPLINIGNSQVDGRPLMRDNLRMSPFNGNTYLPTLDPYSFATQYFDLRSKYTHVPPGNRPELRMISDSAQVFSVTGRNAIVDWVFIQLRSKTNPTTVIATRSALLQRDSDVVDVDGVSPVYFPGIPLDDYYIVVRHRNHLGAMSKYPQSARQLDSLFDFTSPSAEIFDFGTSRGNGINYTGYAQNPNIVNNYMALWAGDLDANKKVKNENPNDDLNVVFFDVFLFPFNLQGNSNFDFSIGYFQGDYDLNSKSKFDNPNDDKNMLFNQLLFYPLNFNQLSNFDFLIEQIP